jgi:hypothetical protein
MGQALLMTLQWLAITLAYASLVAHSASALQAFVRPHLDSGFIFLGAFLLAGLLGLTVRPAWALALATFAMCLGGAIGLGGLLYAPVWRGDALATVALKDYVTQQGLLIMLWSLIPASIGALGGALLAPALRPREPAVDPFGEHERPPWWERETR